MNFFHLIPVCSENINEFVKKGRVRAPPLEYKGRVRATPIQYNTIQYIIDTSIYIYILDLDLASIYIYLYLLLYLVYFLGMDFSTSMCFRVRRNFLIDQNLRL